MMGSMGNLTPARAAAAAEDLIALSHAIQSGTLEKDTKAFVTAAKKASEAEVKLGAAKTEMKTREEAVLKKEAYNARAFTKIKDDRASLKADQDRWDLRKVSEQEELSKARTQLNVSVAAVKDRDSKAHAMMAEARTLMEAARVLDETAKGMKADFEGRISRLEAAAKGA